MDAAVKELHQLRESGLRMSSRIIGLWNSSLSDSVDNLGHEKWAILEQVFIAALDVSSIEVAKTCLKTLQLQFPRSARVNRLLGMLLESQYRYDEAHTLYTSLIETDPTDTIARKRLVAILKAQGQVSEAIDELNNYLKIFMADTEAWGELADLYLSQGDFKHAAFCVEELILANPHNHLLHQRLAEIKYTEGGPDNLRLSSSYFAQACLLNPSNLRALYGLLLVSSTLSSMSGKSNNPTVVSESLNPKAVTSSASEDNFVGFSSSKIARHENVQLSIWASKRIRELYQKLNAAPPFPNYELKLHEDNSEKEFISESENSEPCSFIRLRAQNDDLQMLGNRMKALSTASPDEKFGIGKKSQ